MSSGSEKKNEGAPNINITSHNQMGGVTAHTVHMGRMARTITPALERQILTDLPRDKPITVIAVMGDSEACMFAEQIHAFLKAHNFNLAEPDGISQGMFTPMPKGLGLQKSGEDRLDFVVGVNA